MKPPLPLFAVLFLSSVLLHGAPPPDVPPPTAPFVAAVPSPASWTLAVRHDPLPPLPSGAPRPDSRIKEVQADRFGDLRRDVIVSEDGRTDERWYLKTMVFWKMTPQHIAASQAPDVNLDDPFPSSARGFPGVGWVNLSCYDAPVTFNKTLCYHYAKPNLDAWIDAQTRLPVAYKSGADTYQFTFGDPPGSPLTPPALYQAAMDSYRAMSSQVTVAP